MRDPLRARVAGPLEPFAETFAAELARQGYTHNSAGVQLNLMAHLSRWLEAEGLGAAALAPAAVEAFLASRRRAGYVMHHSPRALVPLLGHLRAAGVAPAPPAPASPARRLEQLIERYRRYLEIERGLAPGTISAYLHSARPFLATRLRGEQLDLAGLGAAEINAFVLAE